MSNNGLDACERLIAVYLGFSICSLPCAIMLTISWRLAITDLPKPSEACSAHFNRQMPETGQRKRKTIS